MCLDLNEHQVKKTFHLKEYESLRKELEFLSNDLRTLEKYVVVSIAAVWTWLLTHQSSFPVTNPVIFLTAWGMPFLFSSLGTIRALSLYKGIEQIGEYIKNIEDAFDIQGWENTQVRISFFFRNSLIAVWIILNLVAIAIPLVIFFFT